MKSLSQSFAATVIAFVSTCGIASAAPTFNNVPEPGSMALVGIAIAGVVAVARKGKK
ncbi:MAG: PEP-CTERM sorting domain-containing protein [Proteobacteria bacterium]|nr:PEP-CTERM sorting domain-containing protein [Pseudomonadota bacterium]